ncbi:hypothetical protein AbraIFM66950_002570 [Aspergillus brasiliensis]|nr:hypothetical protein AbraIFM66950_002570 [Aspergillus brasiliensis]
MPRGARGRGRRGGGRVAANRRTLRDTAIRPKWLWCMCCLRTAAKNFKPEAMELQEPFEIDCVLDAEGSILCQQCFGRRGGCEATAAGVLGNATELVELLDWYTEAIFNDDDEEGEFVVFNEEVRRTANEKVLQLCKAFIQMVATHRRYHGLKVAQKSRHTANYEAFLARRRKLPGVNIEKLVLMPGDPGYILWASAKQSFKTGVSEAIALQFDDEDLDAVRDDVFGDWPVALGEL